ncbi:MAG: 30S ribosomal protein S3 [Alphaproteobacteria bacterium]|nr:MAG: 30S ribosomal protein S3 [Alphaproteobacteria bacterium]
MGQKVNPIGLRLGYTKSWDSIWFAGKDYAQQLKQDLMIRKYIFKNYKSAQVCRVVVERPAKKPNISIYAGRPGILIGKKGADIDALKKNLEKLIGTDVALNIQEERKPDINAKLAAENIAGQLERRVSFRRAMKKIVQSALRSGAEGIRVNVAGRLGGAEIARMEWYREGRVPLHTLRADIDYGTASAHTTYGVCGVKVWIYKGESQLATTPSETQKQS